MSSSNIIKGGGGKKEPVAFLYRPIADREAERPASSCDEFIPLAGNQRPPKPESQSVQAPPEPVDPVMAEGIQAISEEELDRQLLEAFERGVQEGRRHAEKGLANVFKAFRDASASLTALWDKIVRDSEEDLLKLAIMVARKVIQQEISQDRRILAGFVAAAVNGAAERNDIVVRLNPDDYRIFQANRQLYLSGVNEEKNVTLKPDETIPTGGCIVDTPVGAIDARVDVQLEEIYRRLIEERSVAVDAPRIVAEVDSYVRSEN